MTLKSKKKELLKIDYNPYKLKKGFRQWILASLMSAAKNPMLNMIEFPNDDDLLIIDMGCNIGYLTKPLSSSALHPGIIVPNSKDTIT